VTAENKRAGEPARDGSGAARSAAAGALTRVLDAWLGLVARLGPASNVAVPLVLLWIVLSLWIPAFLTSVNIGNLLLASSILGLLAFGETVVMITGEIDLSIGAIEGMASVIAAIVIINHGVAWPLGIAITVGIGVGIGIVNGLVTTIFGIPSFIVTLGVMGVVNGLALQITAGQSIYDFPLNFQFLGTGTLFGVRMPVYIAAGVLIVLFLLLKFTPFGWHVYATGGNRTAAQLVGIPTGRVRVAAFAISGACAGLAGVLISARLNAGSAIFGQNDLLDAIAAVVIGGTSLFGGYGSVIGTALGIILITTVRNALNLLNVSPFWQTVAVGLIIVGSAIAGELNHRLQRRRRATR
jgi:ribose/xylose/arabinose/galactoside ABC-type transport system permease subunit